MLLRTSFHHSYFIALPEAASLAALPSIPVNRALIRCWAHIVIVTWKWKKVYYFRVLTAVFSSGLGYLVDKNTLFPPFPFFNRSEMEKIRAQHLGFVIAMETICFLVTSPPGGRLIINELKQSIPNMTKPPTEDERVHRGRCTLRWLFFLHIKVEIPNWLRIKNKTSLSPSQSDDQYCFILTHCQYKCNHRKKMYTND